MPAFCTKKKSRTTKYFSTEAKSKTFRINHKLETYYSNKLKSIIYYVRGNTSDIYVHSYNSLILPGVLPDFR